MSDPQREVRFCAVAPIELRDADTGSDLINVTGYAAVFGERAEIGPLDPLGLGRGDRAWCLCRGAVPR